jgi:hypothetical protein
MLPRELAPCPGQDLVIQVDVLDVERDVLLRFPVNGFREFVLSHDRQRDLLDDHGVTGQRRTDLLGLERLVAVEHSADGFGDRSRVDDGAVDDGVRRDGFPRQTR